MIKEYLHVSDSSRDETIELEKLASQLSLSETPQQVQLTHTHSHIIHDMNNCAPLLYFNSCVTNFVFPG